MNSETPGEGLPPADALVRMSVERLRARQGAVGRLGVMIPWVVMGALIAVVGAVAGGWMMFVLVACGVALALGAWPISGSYARQMKLRADAAEDIHERVRRGFLRAESRPWPDEPPAR